ncbi:stage II sporulation protein D [Paenibacillaceae bacterium WGS1546]|uniref:stage II sporulation protein D n=1 Tax=Cohnella sp. WGS1546 TaxID=3366810 RepID=UPI00372D2D6F
MKRAADRRGGRSGKDAAFGAWLWIACGVGALMSIALWQTVHREDAGANRIVKIEEEKESARVSDEKEDSSPKESKTPVFESRRSEAIEQPAVRVYLTEERRIETVPLERYVQGVVAAEMPLEFRPAALEAQAIAARTYIVRRLRLDDRSGVPAKGAHVTDTIEHQAYRSLAEMKELRSRDEESWRKAEAAAERTAGEILVYGGEPIEALYFSTSNGYTENSEDVFPAKLPYLRSVHSPWDKIGSPRAEETFEMALGEFYERLGVEAVKAGAGGGPPIRVLERTEGRRVKRMRAGDLQLTGVEARQLLGLRSAAFEWEIRGGVIRLTVYGSGHGVGMSQWGAEGLARAGFDARRILKHYYTDVEIEQVSKQPL